MVSLVVRDLMSREVVSVRPEVPLKEAAKLMVDHAYSGLPVVDEEGHVLGVLSEADLILKEGGFEAVHHRRLARLFGDRQEAVEQVAKIEAVTVAEAMTSPALTIEPDRPVHEAARLMIEDRVSRLPVVENGVIVGIISRDDVIRSYLRSDEEIAKTIREEVLLKGMWIDPATIEVRVEEGLVRLVGNVDRRSTAEILQHLVARVEGVMGVEAVLTWRDDDREIRPEGRDLVHQPRQNP
jgi:CBS domain-containing protein